MGGSQTSGPAIEDPVGGEASVSPMVGPSPEEATVQEQMAQVKEPSPTDSENWGHWCPIAADPVDIGDSDVPRITPVDTTQPPSIPGQRLTALHHALLFDMRRRIAEAAELGVHLYPGPGEPMPQLSHYYGPPADPSAIYDSLAMAGTIGEAYVAQHLGSPAITRQIFGGSATLVRPSEYAAPTPWHSVLPRFPEGPHPPQVLPEPVQEEGRRPKRFREVATSTVDQDLAAEERLHLLLQGKGLFEWGLRPHDVLSAMDRLGVATKGAGGRNDRRERECSISAMGYLQRLLICLRAFINAKAGERPLLALHEPRLFEGPRFTRYRDERVAWGELTTSLRLRTDAALRSKEASNARRAARDSRRRLKPKARAGPGGSTSSDSSSTSVSADEDLHGEGPEEALRFCLKCREDNISVQEALCLPTPETAPPPTVKQAGMGGRDPPAPPMVPGTSAATPGHHDDGDMPLEPPSPASTAPPGDSIGRLLLGLGQTGSERSFVLPPPPPAVKAMPRPAPGPSMPTVPESEAPSSSSSANVPSFDAVVAAAKETIKKG